MDNTKNNTKNITKNNKKTSNMKRKNGGGGLMNTTVTGLSWYTKLTTWITLIFGVILFIGGIGVLMQPSVELDVINAKVSSVKWQGNEGCGVYYKKDQRLYHCDVVASYETQNTDNDSEKTKSTFAFYTESSQRHKIGDDINLYRTSTGISNINPNSWKNLGWFLLLFSTILILMSAFWLWVCSWNRALCAIQGGVGLLGKALDG